MRCYIEKSVSSRVNLNYVNSIAHFNNICMYENVNFFFVRMHIIFLDDHSLIVLTTRAGLKFIVTESRMFAARNLRQNSHNR